MEMMNWLTIEFRDLTLNFQVLQSAIQQSNSTEDQQSEANHSLFFTPTKYPDPGLQAHISYIPPGMRIIWAKSKINHSPEMLGHFGMIPQ